MAWLPDDERHMRRALELAERGRGSVEPNPLVGAVVTEMGLAVAEGWHAQFGGPHAEIMALRAWSGSPRQATLYVTLEPCCHSGKTGPCTTAIRAAGIGRVVIATADPFPPVAGKGIDELRRSGVTVEVGLLEHEARELNAPYFQRVEQQRPWLIAKWAMTLDGKIATAAGESRWISGPTSRQMVHELRGRMDGILVGSGTVIRDDPLLTARPPGPRTATRLVIDRHASIPLHSQLVRTAGDVPVIVYVCSYSAHGRRQDLQRAGCQVVELTGSSPADRLREALGDMAQRGMTNVLVEGGARLLGSLFDQRWINEVHIFVGPLVLGAREAIGPVDGDGWGTLARGPRVRQTRSLQLDGDLYIQGRVDYPS